MNRFRTPTSVQPHENRILVVLLAWIIVAGAFVVLGHVMAQSL